MEAALIYKPSSAFLLAMLVCVPAMAANETSKTSDIIGHVQHLTGSASVVRGSAAVPIAAARRCTRATYCAPANRALWGWC